MKVHVIGGGPAGLYFAILMKKAWPQTQHHGLRAQPAGRHLRLRRGVLRPDARHLRGLRPRELPRDHRPLRLLGRHRDPLQGTTHRIGGNGFCGCSRATLLKILQPARALARRRAQVPDRVRRLDAEHARRRPRGRRRRHQFAHPRDVRGPFPAERRPAAEQVRLDGLDPAVRRLHVLLPRDRARHLHRALLPVRARPLDLDHRDRSARPSRAPASTSSTRQASARFVEERVRRGAAGPQADHQPLDLAQLPDHPLRALGRTTTSCCSATPRRPRISPSARAPSSRWRTRSRCTRRSARPAAATSRRRSRTSRRSAARRSRRPSTPPTCRWSGSSTSSGSGTWTRRASPSA